jgi:hypothetical protein
MTTELPSRAAQSGRAPQRISGPGELLQAVPYLLGFHPRTSLVLVGLAGGHLVVTARLDLADAQTTDAVGATIDAMHLGGATELVAVVYDDQAAPVSGPQPLAEFTLPWAAVALTVQGEAARVGAVTKEVLLVAGPRWWSYSCTSPECCPPVGCRVPDTPSAFAAAATYAGVVPLADRGALEAVLDPLSGTARDALIPIIAAAENEAVAAVLAGGSERHTRSLKRAVFAAARAADALGWTPLTDDVVARFAAALSEIALRDSVWLAVDDGRLDGRALWRDLAARVPAPYDAAPLFLFGWSSWRAGDGALANIAADRAVASDPAYTAADLLLAALTNAVDPRRMPKLRLPRTA